MSINIDSTIKYSSEVSKNWFQKKKYVWQLDGMYEECSYCKKPLTSLTFNQDLVKHHCRACGKIICGLCSRAPKGVVLHRGNPERTCPECWPELEETLKPRIVKCTNQQNQSDQPNSQDDSISPIPINI